MPGLGSHVMTLKSVMRRLLGQPLLDVMLQVRHNSDKMLQVHQKSYQVQREALLHLLLQQPRYADRRRLNQHEFRVYSQSGQDGIIQEIFRRIGSTNKVFVEFGVGAGGGFENNTTYLLANGWNGCWIEADSIACERIRRQMNHLIASGALQLLPARVTQETIIALFEQLNVPLEFDLLSIDIDSCDYWVWKKLSRYRPRVVVIEYKFIPACFRRLGPALRSRRPLGRRHDRVYGQPQGIRKNR